MTGIFMLVVLGGWVAILGWIAAFIVRPIPVHGYRLLLKLALIALPLPLPVADELIGRFQFHGLCRSMAVVELHPGVADERDIVYSPSSIENIDGLVLPVTALRFTLV